MERNELSVGALMPYVFKGQRTSIMNNSLWHLVLVVCLIVSSLKKCTGYLVAPPSSGSRWQLSQNFRTKSCCAWKNHGRSFPICSFIDKYRVSKASAAVILSLQLILCQGAGIAAFTTVSSPAYAYTGAGIELDDDENQLNLSSELQTYQIKEESKSLQQAREPRNMMQGIKNRLSKLNSQTTVTAVTDKEIATSREKVLTLQAYLNEVERDLFEKNWENLQVYLYTFAEQEDAFALLIEQLFPSDDELDTTARRAMSYEAQSMFLYLDDLREAAKDHKFKAAQKAYSNLLLSYDRFLKAGDLYPTYDPISSTEIFFADTPRDTLRFDSSSKVQVLDEVILTSGPDMGKKGTVINIDDGNAVVKLDKDGKAYQEVKYVKYSILAKAEPDVKQKKGNVKNAARNKIN